jgi:hypothetical protein
VSRKRSFSEQSSTLLQLAAQRPLCEELCLFLSRDEPYQPLQGI